MQVKPSAADVAKMRRRCRLNGMEREMLQKADIAEVLRAEQQLERRRGLVRIGVIVAVAVLVLAGLVWLWSAWQSGRTAAYVTDAVTRGDVVVTLTATGTLAPVRQVAVTSLVTGTVAAVRVDYNQSVSRGQVLAELDTPDIDMQVKRAMAMVDAQAASRDAAAAAVTDAEAALRRATELPQGQFVSIRDVELATTAVQRAKANLAAATAQLQAAVADLDGARSNKGKATITAPIDGVVLAVDAHVGETVNAASLAASLFTLASDLHQLELELDIDEADVPQVAAGNPVLFTVEANPNEQLNGVVRQVRTGPTVSNGVTSYKAVIAVDNPDLRLKPGMTVTADISTDAAHDVLTVSNAGLRFSPDQSTPAGPFAPRSSIELPSAGGQHVYVLAEGQLKPVALTTGRTDGQRTEVVSGELAEGDLVATALGGS